MQIALSKKQLVTLIVLLALLVAAAVSAVALIEHQAIVHILSAPSFQWGGSP
ncbi:hypothetical protein KTAU_09540 [Thermogemmatispora aurantia]|jgi:LPS O-antigen subunit length determinant protein (WzzB/FepE family)|uniref:Uncharacterized protein n=1 Tax=Thermogemmatispora aurantia TaxID=2045279 RepID=A0A5J4K855_9CHLR|nr:hypothetical protein [Thermogemmatispora aurantia]GER82316.1 hypothetical protein KTAU_09540 [Thermogemmatispora aurantia]